MRETLKRPICMDYYFRTCKYGKEAEPIITLEEYKEKLLNDSPALIDFNWGFLEEKSCFTNAEFLCSYNFQLKKFNESLHYCEGIVASVEDINNLKKDTIYCVHHSWIYSTKFNCYVDCTPSRFERLDEMVYLISDELSGKALKKFIDSLYNSIKKEFEPRFILKSEPLEYYVTSSAFE